MPIEITISGTEALVKRLKDTEAKLGDISPALRIVSEALEIHVTKQFDTQGLQGGATWAPLAFSTVQRRARRSGYYQRAPQIGVSFSAPVMVWSGEMKNSFRKGRRYHIGDIGRNTLHWGSRLTRAQMLAFRRPILVFRDKTQKALILKRPISLWISGKTSEEIRSAVLNRI